MGEGTDQGQGAAAVKLGRLLARQGHTAEARQAFERAMTPRNDEHTIAAAFELGALLAAEGDVAGARAMNERAIASRHPQYAPAALVNQGILLRGQGDASGARKAYEQAILSGHPDEGPKAAFNLGNMLWASGDNAGARKAYERAIASGHKRYKALAENNLAGLFHSEGRFTEAYRTYLAAGADGYAGAVIGLIQLQIDDDHLDAALTSFRVAVPVGAELGELGRVSSAGLALGVALFQAKDFEHAAEVFREVTSLQQPDDVPRAAFNLGSTLLQRGEPAEARQAFTLAAQTGDGEIARMALANLKAIS